ncbi:hypothetical protein D9M68_582980 [compost metagenome]
MRTSLIPPLLAGCLLAAHPSLAPADTVVPLQGQNSQQIQDDVAGCQAQANSTLSAAPSSTTPHTGGRLRGAAAGAVAGATAAEVRGRQHDELYDRVDDDVKQDYRQNRAQSAAAAGAVVGGMHQRQERRQDRRADEAATQQQSANAQQAYLNCMSSRGYSISP